MTLNIEIVVLSILLIIFNQICIKYNFFLDKVQNSSHKKFIVRKDLIPITGGLYLILGYLIIGQYIFNFIEIFFFLVIFLLGYLSDVLKSFLPVIRLFIQGLICLIFLFYFKVSISDVRIEIFNDLLEYNFASYLFTLFCVLVLMNGSNFMDGVNLLSIGYFLMVLISIFLVSKNYDLETNIILVKELIVILSFLLLMNSFNKVFLGDSGIYLLSFLIAIILIKFYNDNEFVSPYYIISLLWYPCFENLFSIIRKKLKNIDPQRADNLHLHHLLYKKFYNIESIKIRNNLTGLSIILFNIPIFLLSSFNYNHTKILVILIFFNVFFYLITYSYLKRSS